MRYSFIGKINGEQCLYLNISDALLDAKRMFGDDVDFYIIRSILCTCITEFTFENDSFILKARIV